MVLMWVALAQLLNQEKLMPGNINAEKRPRISDFDYRGLDDVIEPVVEQGEGLFRILRSLLWSISLLGSSYLLWSISHLLRSLLLLLWTSLERSLLLLERPWRGV